MQPCPSNMIRNSFTGLHQLNPETPASFDAENFLDHLIASMPSGQWPDLSGPSAVQLAGDAGVAGTDQSQMFMMNGATGEFVEDGYQDGVVAGDGSFFDSFPDQGQMEGTFTGQSLVTSGLDIGGGSGTTSPSQPKKKVRARRGQATDPHSIAERLRRVRISERMKALQELVPNANRTDKASMLDEIIEYVKFLQVQVKLLSASRLGGAAGGITRPAVDNSSQERGGSLTATGGGSSLSAATEQRVAKMMEEDMGSAMQYLQGKGLCLMPISLAATISGSTGNHGAIAALSSTSGDRQSSPGVSMLAV